MVTIFENIYSDKPFYTSVEIALQRIKTGKSKGKIDAIRATIDAEKADLLKRQLPSVCFSGKFKVRKDESLLKHSGFICLDFDRVSDIGSKMGELASHPFVHAAWISPRGNGIKALVKVSDGTKHREHFEALKEIFPDTDKTSINPSRVCYESYDPNIYINPKSQAFTKIKMHEVFVISESIREDQEVFQRLLKWLSNRNDAFVTGERNIFIFKLASACCRFGLSEESATRSILLEFPPSNDFKQIECEKAVKSAYRANKSKTGTASFDRDILVDKVSRSEVELDASIYDLNVKPRDVVYGIDVKISAIEIYKKGYEQVTPIGVPLVDEHFKLKRGEITCLTGVGNYGKSSFYKWFQLMRVLKFGEKFVSFSPEDNPPEEYYHDFVEMLLGQDCTPSNPLRPGIDIYSNAYDFVSNHIFYVYPKELIPTPEYIKERFLEMVIKEKVDGCCIDPFNQMRNDYAKSGGRSDKYLETTLSDFSRFAQMNNVYMIVIAHPHMLNKQPDGNYPCPDVFDINDGAMWNNKMDNILVYHRPFMQTNPENPLCQFHSKKIRRQKTVGKKGYSEFEYKRKTRRFEFNGYDPIAIYLRDRGLKFDVEQKLLFDANKSELEEAPF